MTPFIAIRIKANIRRATENNFDKGTSCITMYSDVTGKQFDTTIMQTDRLYYLYS